MKSLQYKCTLLSDVILNQKSASEGQNMTLDFIPGNNFLGIVAAKVYAPENSDNDTAFRLFHSGEVRFGDAHPSKDNTRGLKVPAAFFVPKGKKLEEDVFVHHHIPDPSSEEMRKLQLKQSRSGFYSFNEDNTARQVETSNSVAIKSAYNNESRKSQDEQLFAYQSLNAGLKLLFTVEIDNEDDENKINKFLLGTHKIGRSRSAQYGLVKIESAEFETPRCEANGKEVTVYADGRLIFLDENGMPTLQPTAEQLGCKGGKILWSKSQVRTFCYAPYNYKRRCFDTDRCGIEKGSVFVIETAEAKTGPAYIGSYRNEGFGAVLYNPTFLSADNQGKASVKFLQEKANDNKPEAGVATGRLIDLLERRRDKEKKESGIFDMVNVWVNSHAKQFHSSDSRFASQWGTIRTLAMQYKTQEKLKNAIADYLTHGVAEQKWRERNRLNDLQSFIDKLNDNNAAAAVVNLAAAMAKKCRKEEKK